MQKAEKTPGQACPAPSTDCVRAETPRAAPGVNQPALHLPGPAWLLWLCWEATAALCAGNEGVSFGAFPT